MTKGEMSRVGRKMIEAVTGAEGYRPWRWHLQTRCWTRWSRAKPGDLRFVWSQYWVRVEVFKKGKRTVPNGHQRGYWQFRERILYSKFYEEVRTRLGCGI